MDDCLFCKIVKGEIPSEKVYEDEDVLCFKDINPVAPIHILVIPKKHIGNLLEVKPEDGKIIIKIYETINKIAKDLGFEKEGFRVITNCGKNAGQEVMHLHFHVIAGKKLRNEIIVITSFETNDKNNILYKSKIYIKYYIKDGEKMIKRKKEVYEKKAWNKRLINYIKKIDNGKFSVSDAEKFIEDYFNADFQSDTTENTNIIALKDRLELIRGVLAKYYKCNEDEIYIGNYKYKISEDGYPGKIDYKVIFGDADFYDLPYGFNMNSLQIIEGNADFEQSKIESLCDLQSIRGNAYFNCPNLRTLGNLQNIAGNAYFGSNEFLESLGKLKKIGGTTNLRYSHICDLGNLQSTGKLLAYCCGMEIDNLTQLRRILPEKAKWNKRLIEYKKKIAKGEFTTKDVPGLVEDFFKEEYYEYPGDMKYCKMENTNIKDIKESLYLIKGKIAQYYKCKEREVYIGNINFREQYFFPYKVIFGNASLKKSNTDTYKYRGFVSRYLNGIQVILGNADFRDSQITNLNNLKIIGGNAYFDSYSIKSIKKLKYVGGQIIGNDRLKSQYESKIRRKGIISIEDLARLDKKMCITNSEVYKNFLHELLRNRDRGVQR